MAFGSLSGSAPATVAAMGRMVYPEMRKSGFSDRFLARTHRLQRGDRAFDPALDHPHHLWLDDRDVRGAPVRGGPRRRHRARRRLCRAGGPGSAPPGHRAPGKNPAGRNGSTPCATPRGRWACPSSSSAASIPVSSTPDRGGGHQRRLCDLRRTGRVPLADAQEAFSR